MAVKNEIKTKVVVGQALEKVKNAVRVYLQKENGEYLIPKRRRRPLYLYGGPGLGKTEMPRQAAKELGIGFVSFNLTHLTKNSLAGLPKIKDLSGNEYTEYTTSEIIAAVLKEEERGYKEGILLIDEFNCVSETILPIMLEFLQTGRIGTHSLPDGWILILCGNPPKYNKSARNFDAAIMDRVRCIEVIPDCEDFLKYAGENGMHYTICSFLEQNPDRLYIVGDKEYSTRSVNSTVKTKAEDEIVTPRGWEALSCALKGYEKLGIEIDEELVYEFIRSDKTAYDFFRFYTLNRLSFTEADVDKILNGKTTALFLSSMSQRPISFLWQITEYLAKNLDREAKRSCDQGKGKEIVSTKLSNAFKFVSKLPEGEKLKENLFMQIGSSKNLGKVLLEVNNEDYMELCERMYGVKKIC